MSTIVVCPDGQAETVAAELRPSHVVSLSSPGAAGPVIGEGERLALVFHDIDAPRPGLVEPDDGAIASLLAFGTGWPAGRPLLVHCRMGISRSTAAAVILAASCRPDVPVARIALALRRAAPCATPNALMIDLADRRLGLGGRLAQAVRAIGRGEDYRPYRMALLDLS